MNRAVSEPIRRRSFGLIFVLSNIKFLADDFVDELEVTEEKAYDSNSYNVMHFIERIGISFLCRLLDKAFLLLNPTFACMEL
ncbi:hypothetical protein ASD37_08395 [Mycobacterium sp. Root135]|nr:hypothetical protein ASD37_08395 [Mycobacterium sp. Root135]